MATILVVGDVGGCSDELAKAVAPILDDAGTVVIQVGDLVDRGPDSSGVLAIVDNRLRHAGRRWVQLIGNHEAQYLGAARFWRQSLSPADVHLLRTWWLRDRVRVAAAIRLAHGEEFLLTHAGLTFEAWRELGEPVTAATAADLLNTRPEPLLWAYDGPLWADATTVYASWQQAPHPPPFGQIHGHSSIVSYRHEAWLCDERTRQRSTVDWVARHTVTRISGARFIGVDPKHGRNGAASWAPLVLEDAEILA
jgi:hypothetical protein